MNAKRRIIIIALLVVALSIAVSVGSASGSPLAMPTFGELPKAAPYMGSLGIRGTPPGQRGMIAFGRSCSNPEQAIDCTATSEDGVYLMNADGSGLRQIVAGINASSPSFSPDGSWIVFQSGSTYPHHPVVEPEVDLYRVKTDGTDLQQLTGAGVADDDVDTDADFLTDGRIIFVSRKPWTKPTLYVVNPDGTNLQPVTQAVGSASTDGRRIVLSRCRKRPGRFPCSIYLYSPDGTMIRRLTRAARADINPVFSPDGRQIAFERRYSLAHESRPPSLDIFLVPANGKGRARRMGKTGARQYRYVTRHAPVWSPDGNSILFEKDSYATNHTTSTIQFGIKDLSTGSVQILEPETTIGDYVDTVIWSDPDWQAVP